MRVATNLIAICRKYIDKKAMQIIFCLIFIFNYIANKLFLNFKDIVHIKKNPPFDLLTLTYIKSHNYNQNSNEKDYKIPPLFPFSSIIYLLVFVRLAYDTNNISYKLFVALPIHQACAKNNRDKL